MNVLYTYRIIDEQRYSNRHDHHMDHLLFFGKDIGQAATDWLRVRWSAGRYV